MTYSFVSDCIMFSLEFLPCIKLGKRLCTLYNSLIFLGVARVTVSQSKLKSSRLVSDSVSMEGLITALSNDSMSTYILKCKPAPSFHELRGVSYARSDFYAIIINPQNHCIYIPLQNCFSSVLVLGIVFRLYEWGSVHRADTYRRV